MAIALATLPILAAAGTITAGTGVGATAAQDAHNRKANDTYEGPINPHDFGPTAEQKLREFARTGKRPTITTQHFGIQGQTGY